MKKIVLLGRGGAGKSTTARKIGEIASLPVIELDKYFWHPGLIPLSKYDVLNERLKLADTIIILNFPFWTCFLRASKRSKERMDFWWWLFTWRFLELPKIMKMIKDYSPTSAVIIIKSQKELDNFLMKIKNN